MVVNTVISVTIAFLLAFQCRPINFFWTRWDKHPGGTCLAPPPILWGNTVFTMVLDLWVLLMPLPYVARLQLSVKRRIGISFMLAVGVTIVVFSLLKFFEIRKMETSENPTELIARVTVWTALEICVGVICACLPGMRMFVGYFLHRWGWTGSSSTLHSHHVSFRTPSGSGQKTKASRSSQANIRITTMIHTQQNEGPPSESYLPLHAIELGHTHGTVRSHAWA